MAVVPATTANIDAAGALIRSGALVAFPTETVYGLGADATNGEAVARIFAAKGRPRFNPLIVHVTGLAAAEELASLPPLARRLAERFWPGPLTLVLARRPPSQLSDLVSAGLDTVALRVPDHPIARALIAAAERPIAAPSANRSGHVSPTCAAHVAADLGDKVAMILNGGDTRHGLESTVVRVIDERIVLLRPGAVTANELQDHGGAAVVRAFEAEAAPHSPGQLASHYAPHAAIRLDIDRPRAGEALLAFGPDAPAHDGPALNLSADGNLIEAAARLFGALRMLDATGVKTIAVMPIPADGLGEAINDRLQRAAAPRP
ncbi:MAG: threonylcarbamoyl-AMP synthase [Hyphomicrobiaceae bacterium]|nr:threonylcarbamoyl-AMP synthase [Hyphomicrobiaceae bacterium]